MLDGCGIETSLPWGEAYPRQRVAIDARWLWDRDMGDETAGHRRLAGSRSMLDGCGIETSASTLTAASRSPVAIDARWLWDRDSPSPFPGLRGSYVAIDARWLWNRDRGTDFECLTPTRSRSMLDGCGIETGNHACERTFAVHGVAIDARWLWNRDSAVSAHVTTI